MQLKTAFSLMLFIFVGACANRPAENSVITQFEREIEQEREEQDRWMEQYKAARDQITPTAKQVALTPKQIEQVKAGVRSGLRDPDSAKFEGIIGIKIIEEDGIATCGSVNAKNGYGGYGGKHSFRGWLSPEGEFTPMEKIYQGNPLRGAAEDLCAKNTKP